MAAECRFLAPPGYGALFANLNTRILANRVRASIAVNFVLVRLDWQIGRDILARQSEQGWGARIVNRIAADLRTITEALPTSEDLEPGILLERRHRWVTAPQTSSGSPLTLETWLLHAGRPERLTVDAKLAVALTRAGDALARLDQALNLHPVLPALLYRARLEAVRRQAAVDVYGIDPWHLAAMLGACGSAWKARFAFRDCSEIFVAARTALGYHHGSSSRTSIKKARCRRPRVIQPRPVRARCSAPLTGYGPSRSAVARDRRSARR